MIYETAVYANADETMVTGTDVLGGFETVPTDFTLFRQPDDGPQGFLARGGVIAPFVEPPTPPPDLQPYQFKSMLALSGKQGELEAFIEALPEPARTVAKAKLEYSLVFKRDNELVLGAQAGMGLTDAELDALWLQASSIQ